MEVPFDLLTDKPTASQEHLSVTACRDGDVVFARRFDRRIRVMKPQDEAGLLALLQSLSEDSRGMRFYSLPNDAVLAVEAHREANLDHTFALVACSGVEQRIVGHAFYIGIDEQRAEVAFTIANNFRGPGLGTLLLCQLAEVASANGIQVFEAEVVGANHAMLHVFRESGFPLDLSASAGQVHVTFPTSFTAEGIQRFERRESIAAVNELKTFLRAPRRRRHRSFAQTRNYRRRDLKLKQAQ